MRRGKNGDIPPSSRDTMGEFRGGTLSFWSDLPVSLHITSSSASGIVHPDWGRVRLSTCQCPDRRRLGCHPAGTQTGGLGYTPLSNFYRKPIKPEPSWNMSLSRRQRNWLNGVMISEPNRLGGMQGGGHRWLTKLMPLPRRYCPRKIW